MRGPVAIFPLDQEYGSKEVLNEELEGIETNVAYDRSWSPLGLIGSPQFDKALNNPSFIKWETKGSFSFSHEITLMMWIKPFSTEDKYLLLDATNDDGTDVYFLKMKIDDGKVIFTIKAPGSTKAYRTPIDLELIQNGWNFVAFTVNSEDDQAAIFLNEGFGEEANTSMYFSLENYNWIPKIFEGEQVKLGGLVSGPGENFDGAVSCFQIFDYAMDPATIQLKKYCPDLPQKSKPCPIGQSYFDGMCYEVSATSMTFAQAEVACMPNIESPHEKRLISSKNLEHLDFVAHLAKENGEALSVWAGISDNNEDGTFIDSFGNDFIVDLFKDDVDLAKPCGMLEFGSDG